MQPDYLQSIFILAGAGATFVKIIDALVRMGKPDAPEWLWPVLAVADGVGFVALLMLVGGQSFTGLPVVAQAILAGVLAAGMALGVTELDRRVEQRRVAASKVENLIITNWSWDDLRAPDDSAERK